MRVDFAGRELRLDPNAFLLQHRAEHPRGHRSGEGAVERRHVNQLDFVPNPPASEEGVGEKDELQRSNRALDGHLDHVHHQPAAGKARQGFAQRPRPVQSVEIENALSPFAVEEARSILGHDPRAAGNHQQVVGQALTVR
jgi:hypothetical protein